MREKGNPWKRKIFINQAFEREREANKSEDTRLLSSAPRGGEARRGWFEASNVIVKSSTNESSGESGRSPYAAAIAIRR